MSWKIEDNRAIFSIGTVADILGVKPRVLRLLEEHGFVKPERTQNNRRLYSLSDVNYIAYLAYLKTVKKGKYCRPF
jgi:MerR family transcriptional regulator/heat shock protein HspR